MNSTPSLTRSSLNRSETTTHNGAQEPSAAGIPASPSASRLANLPNELLRPIARLVPPRDRQNLLLAAPQLRPVIGEDVRGGMLAAEYVPKVKNFNQFETALDKIEKLPRSCRQEPLLALASRIEHLPEEKQTDAFNKLSEASGELLTVDQHKVLSKLADQVSSLPEDTRLKAFEKIFKTGSELKGSGGANVLSNLASQIRMLPQDERLAAFRQIFDASDKLPAKGRADVLSRLARSAVSSLPSGERSTAIDDLCKARDALPASHSSIVQDGLNSLQFSMIAQTHIDFMMLEVRHHFLMNLGHF